MCTCLLHLEHESIVSNLVGLFLLATPLIGRPRSPLLAGRVCAAVFAEVVACQVVPRHIYSLPAASDYFLSFTSTTQV